MQNLKTVVDDYLCPIKCLIDFAENFVVLTIARRVNYTCRIMAKKQTTIDDLAVMVQKGFRDVDHRFRDVDHRFQNLESQMVTKDMLKLVVESVDIIREDVRDIKITLGPLVRMVSALETDMQHLAIRVARLEQKSGFIKK